MATTSVQKIGAKGQVTLPKHIREAIGLKAGDLVETVLTREGALTRPVELHPRKVELKKRLETAEADVRAGRVYGPFKTAGATVRALKREQRARARRPH